MKHLLVLCCVLGFISLAQGQSFYTASDDVVNLNDGNFQKMLASDQLWLVEFYAPWCGHCKNLSPEWKKAASALKGVVKVAAVDMTEHQALGQPYGITGFPTIKIFGGDKKNPKDYAGQRTASEIIKTGLKEAKNMVMDRAGGKKDSKPKASSSNGGKKSTGGSKGSSSGGNKVQELNSNTFRSKVLDSNELWMVEFYAPWCGHCKALAPEWKDAASQLTGKVNLGAVDCTEHAQTCQQYGVQGYPTIKVFGVDKKKAEDYPGQRKADSIVQFATNLWEKNAVTPDVIQITSAGVLDDCTEAALCVVTFLPHILDSQASGRNAYLDTLKKVAKANKAQNVKYVWAEAFEQQQLEGKLQVGGSGYPAVAVIAKDKNKYDKMAGTFDSTAIGRFIGTSLRGTRLMAYDTLPSGKTTKAWDGQDGTPYAEEL